MSDRFPRTPGPDSHELYVEAMEAKAGNVASNWNAWLSRFEELAMDCRNASFECGEHDGTSEEYEEVLKAAYATQDALLAHVMKLKPTLVP